MHFHFNGFKSCLMVYSTHNCRTHNCRITAVLICCGVCSKNTGTHRHGQICQWRSSVQVGGGMHHTRTCAGARYSKSPWCWRYIWGTPVGAVDRWIIHRREFEQEDGLEHWEHRWYRLCCIRFDLQQRRWCHPPIRVRRLPTISKVCYNYCCPLQRGDLLQTSWRPIWNLWRQQRRPHSWPSQKFDGSTCQLCHVVPLKISQISQPCCWSWELAASTYDVGCTSACRDHAGIYTIWQQCTISHGWQEASSTTNCIARNLVSSPQGTCQQQANYFYTRCTA